MRQFAFFNLVFEPKIIIYLRISEVINAQAYPYVEHSTISPHLAGDQPIHP